MRTLTRRVFLCIRTRGARPSSAGAHPNLGAFTLPLPPGEQCAKRVDVEVTAGKKDGKLSLKVGDPLGDRDTDSIKLKCAAAP
jgi:hypothetical protein